MDDLESRSIKDPRQIPFMYGDTPPFMALPYRRELPDLADGAAILGMPFDGVATLRGGATRHAPSAIRKMSLLYGSFNMDWDLDVFSHVRTVDAGDIDVVPGDARESYSRCERRVAEICAMGAVPFVIGGDHGITYPAVKGVASTTGGPLGLIVFDTHLDLAESFRDDRLTRASPMKRIAELPEVDPHRMCIIGAKGPRNLPEWPPLAAELGIHIFGIETVEQKGIRAVVHEALALASPDGTPPYVSVDIDAVDAAFAPGTNSIEVGGLTSREIIAGVRLAAERGLAGFDVVEVAPEFDNPTGQTSALAARLIAEALAAMAASRAGKTRAWAGRLLNRKGNNG